jgi:hypothetical protein
VYAENVEKHLSDAAMLATSDSNANIFDMGLRSYCHRSVYETSDTSFAMTRNPEFSIIPFMKNQKPISSVLGPLGFCQKPNEKPNRKT